MGLILDDNNKGLHAEARRESFSIYTNFGRDSIELEWVHLNELSFLVGKLTDYANSAGLGIDRDGDPAPIWQIQARDTSGLLIEMVVVRQTSDGRAWERRLLDAKDALIRTVSKIRTDYYSIVLVSESSELFSK